MKIRHVERDVTFQGITGAQTPFAISQTNQSHVMAILREGLYSDRYMAVLREYASNAWDAHASAGILETPIKITLPTPDSLILSIRDYGQGMSETDMVEVFTQYGESTKRDNNDNIGMLGIGSKSGFAYTDAFTIISYHKGLKSTYSAVLDQTNIGSLTKLIDEPCQESGLEVIIPVLKQDIKEFQNRAITLFRHFKPKPIININIPKSNSMEFEHGFVDHTRDSNWVAVMGCIPYKVNLDHIKDDLINLGYYQPLARMSGGLYFQIGDVEVSANREELKYTDLTKSALIDHLVSLFHELLADIESADTTDWEKRLRIRVLDGYDNLPKELSSYSASLKNHTTFVLQNSYGMTNHISINPLSRLIIKDDSRRITGWALQPFDHIVRPVNKTALPLVKSELDGLLKQARLDGIPIINISTLPWESVRGSSVAGKPSNKKHKARCFMLHPNLKGYQYPWGKCWQIVDRKPTESDVYVNLQAFIPPAHGTRFYDFFYQDRELLNGPLGEGFTMPPIYGYKDTKDHPGIRYNEWRKQILPQILETDVVKSYLDRWQWAYVFSPYLGGVSRYLREHPEKALEGIRQNLGKSHPLTEFFSNFVDGYLFMKDQKGGLASSIDGLLNFCDPAYSLNTPARKSLDELLARYPLFTALDKGIQILAGDHCKQWCDYVLLVDQ